jgi:hypothetical protein
MFHNHGGVTVGLFLQVVGTTLFILAGLGIPDAPRFRLVAWGLAAWGLSVLLPF